MPVRIKVRCNAKADGEVHFTTVYELDASRNEENARYTLEIPWGDIRLCCDSKAVLAKFKVNAEYYVDFEEAFPFGESHVPTEP